jgi:hypothetical protein
MHLLVFYSSYENIWSKIKKNVCRVLVGKPKVKEPLEDLDRDAQGVLKWISKK